MSYLRYHPRTVWEDQELKEEEKREDVAADLAKLKLEQQSNSSLLLPYRDAADVPHHTVHDVHTTINVAAADGKTTDGKPPAQHFVPRANGKPQRNYQQVAAPVVIKDLRGKESQYSLEQNGFALIRTKTDTAQLTEKVLAFDNEWFERSYYPESARIIKEVTGAGRVVVWNHTIRGGPDSRLKDAARTKTAAPIQSAHVDRVPRTAHSVAQILLTSEELYKAKSFQIINLWRPFGWGVHDYPLGLCDWKTFDLEKDIQPTLNFRNETAADGTSTPGGEGLYGEGIQIKHNEKQQWYYWGGQQPDEALLILNYNSRSRALNEIAGAVRAMEDHEDRLDDSAGFTAHTAFADEEGKKVGLPRQSIEVRAVVLYY